MAKPILVIRNSQEIDFSERNQMYDSISGQVEDYHVFIVFEEGRETLSFEVYNGENLDPITIEELKELINGSSKETP